MNPIVRRVISLLTTCTLMVCLVGSGYVVVSTFDFPTQFLSQAYSTNEYNGLTDEEMTELAVATKRYTFNDNDRAALYTKIAQVNQRAADQGFPGALGGLEGKSTAEQEALIATNGNESYVLTPDALDHLDDCYRVAQGAAPILLGAFVASMVGLLILVFGVRPKQQRLRTLGWVFLMAGALVLLMFMVLGAWIALDFAGFFAVFHSLFFAAGTWTFDVSSLLISMYPTEFWVGMGAFWLGTTILLSILSIIIGITLRRRLLQMRSQA